VALTMRALGFENAFALTGGFDAWVAAGGRVEPLARSDPATNSAHHQPM
jgi:3-mercaptopyruvate sulfurtransferase SseA